MCFGGRGLAGVVVVAGSATVFDGGFVEASFPGTVMVEVVAVIAVPPSPRGAAALV